LSNAGFSNITVRLRSNGSFKIEARPGGEDRAGL
jgi:hypothetical protein